MGAASIEPEASKEANAAAFDLTHDDVFSRIAARYDLLCDLFSLGIHRRWKGRMSRRIHAARWKTMLDVAAGTGHIALRVARLLDAAEARTCIVSDICPAMLAIAQKRAGPLAAAIDFRTLDAHHLAGVEPESIDLYSISLGLKICDRAQVLAEAYRVLRPGGTFVCLEASRIPVSWIHAAYLAYMRLCMPLIGWIATGGDTSAYLYLLKGVQDFPGAAALAAEIAGHGFVEIDYERLSFGIVAIHVARKPA